MKKLSIFQRQIYTDYSQIMFFTIIYNRDARWQGRSMFSIFQGAICQNWPFLWKYLQLLVDSAIKVNSGKKNCACQSAWFCCSQDFRTVRVLLAVTLWLEIHIRLRGHQATLLVQYHGNISEGLLFCMLQARHSSPGELKKNRSHCFLCLGRKPLWGDPYRGASKSLCPWSNAQWQHLHSTMKQAVGTDPGKDTAGFGVARSYSSTLQSQSGSPIP